MWPLADVEKGNLTSLEALLDGRTRGAALTAQLDARLDTEKQDTLVAGLWRPSALPRKAALPRWGP